MQKHYVYKLAAALVGIGCMILLLGYWIGSTGKSLTFRTLAQEINVASDDPVVNRPRFVVIASPQEIASGLNTVIGNLSPMAPILAQLRGLDYTREFAVLVLAQRNIFTGKVTVQEVTRKADAITITAAFDVPPSWQVRPTVSVSPYHLIAVSKEGVGGKLITFTLREWFSVIERETHLIP